ncbi:hypothetical protein VNO80_06702 [Phaseolus coccineus]|uniref:Uncharacterized protein n=1 Tax=Phaseolus coccineus TaxID=3886 RepID=A0AAN9NIS4_PHACN
MPLSSCSSERVSKQPSTVAVVELNKRSGFPRRESSHSSSSSGFLLAVEAVAVLERVPYSIWFHSTSPLTYIALGQRASLRNLFLLSFRGHEMNPEVTLSLASLFAPQLYSLRSKRRLSNSQQVKAFFGWGPRVPPPTTQFLSLELHYGDRLLSAMALHLVGKSERK